ncbi:MAG: BatD family protein [Candidatus Zixiibacteriota bacterium]
MRTDMYMRKYYIISILILIALGLVAQTSITSSIDKNEITIGEKVNYKVEIQYPKSSALNTPAIGQNLGMFEIKNFEVKDPIEQEEGNLRQEIEYEISTYTTGDYTIPPIAITVTHEKGDTDTLMTQPIKINVKSLLEGKSPDELDIRGIKAPLEYPKDYTWIWYLAAGILLLLAIIFILLYYFKRKKEGLGLFDFVSPPKPAYQIALERLEQIEDLHYTVFDEAKAYFIELSEILREYIEKQIGVEALEMTTMETVEGLRKETELSTKLIADVQTVLGESDMVKFAHMMPEKQLGSSLWKLAHNFVITTKPKEEYGDSEDDDNEIDIIDDKAGDK